MINIDEEINVTGMCCPMPLIRISQAVEALGSGKTIRIVGDDPIFEQGVRDFCELKQFEIMSILTLTGRTVEIVIKK